MFLKVFAAVISPKQLYLHQQLFDFYTSILARSETNIVKVAYDCILGYKPPYLMPVRENVRRLLDDKKIRDELVVFDPSVGGDGVRSSRSSAAVDEGQLGVSHITFMPSPPLFFLIRSPLFSFALLLANIHTALASPSSTLAYLLPSFLPCSRHFIPLLCPLHCPPHLSLPHLTSPHPFCAAQCPSLTCMSICCTSLLFLFLLRSSIPHIVKNSYR